ncbi:MAG: lipid II flippase MurJ, partial [Thermodesulfobacteriota bacterium]|nr:lipid II flippase MurJ [Thermodesulfobacteriota bacterium]
GVHAIALGYVIGEIFRLAILIGVIKRLNLFKLGISLQLNPRLREFFKTASYQTIGMAAVGLNPAVDKTMANWLGEGSVSVLYYADRLYAVPVLFVTSGLMVTLLSHWSETFYRSSERRIKEDVKKAIKWVGILTLPIMLFLVLFHRPVVYLVFNRGEFAPAKLLDVAWVWVCYLLGLVPYAIGQVFVRAHLALKNTVILMRCSLCLIILNILLNYVLMTPLKVAGIAIASSIAPFFTILYLGGLFYRRREIHNE